MTPANLLSKCELSLILLWNTPGPLVVALQQSGGPLDLLTILCTKPCLLLSLYPALHFHLLCYVTDVKIIGS